VLLPNPRGLDVVLLEYVGIPSVHNGVPSSLVRPYALS
jgi:hypothetical protein